MFFVLVVGCICVVKFFEMMLLIIVMLGEFLIEVGLFDGVCNIVFGYGDLVGSLMSIYDDVDMVFFIGFIVVGKCISKVVSDILKKVVLEFGGKNL